MYAIVLELPYRVTLVHKKRFDTQEEAEQFAGTLPGKFQTVKEEEVPAGAIPIPLKEKK